MEPHAGAQAGASSFFFFSSFIIAALGADLWQSGVQVLSGGDCEWVAEPR